MPLVNIREDGSLIKQRQYNEIQGQGAYHAILTNESHTIMCDENRVPKTGEIGASGAAVTGLLVYKGVSQLIYSADDSPAVGEYAITGVTLLTGTGWVATENTVTGEVYVSTVGTTDSATFSIEITFNDGASITKTFSLDVSKNGTLVDLTASNQILRYDKDEVIYPASDVNILLTATPKQVVLGYYKWYRKYDDGSYSSSLQSSITPTYTIDKSTFPNFTANAVYKVEIYEDADHSTKLDEDTITITKVKDGDTGETGADGADGEDSYQVVLTNENHTIQCLGTGDPITGEIGSSGKARTQFLVFVGVTQQTYTSSDTPNPGYFSIVNITLESGTGWAATENTSTGEVYISTVGSSDTALFSIGIKFNDGAIIYKKFTLNKITKGPIVTVTASSQILRYDTDGIIYPASNVNITFTATPKLVAAAYYKWRIKYDDGSYSIVQQSTSATYTFSTSLFGNFTTALTVKVELYENSEQITMLDDDIITVIKVQDGETGADGADGADGDPGPGIVYRGEYDTTGATYYYCTTNRKDVVKGTNGQYYICTSSHTGSSLYCPVTGANYFMNWVSFGATFSSVATKILLAEDGTILYTLTMGTPTGDAIIKSNGVTNLTTGDGFYLKYAYSSGYTLFRVGNVSGGALTKGMAWTGTYPLIESDTFSLKSNGHIQIRDAASGNVLFDSENKYADSKNISRIIATSISGNSATSSTYVTVLEEVFLSLPYELYVVGAFRGYTTSEGTWGRCRLLIYEATGTLSYTLRTSYTPSQYFGSGTPACFNINNTWITMSNGLRIPIKSLKKGDLVKSYDFNNKIFTESRITGIIDKEVEGIYILNEGLEVTGSHPFFVHRLGWTKAENLEVGMLLFYNNKFIKLETKIFEPKKLFVRSLSVDPYHNYFANGFFVHNKPPDDEYFFNPGILTCDFSTYNTSSKIFKAVFQVQRYQGTGSAVVRDCSLMVGRHNVFRPETVEDI